MGDSEPLFPTGSPLPLLEDCCEGVLRELNSDHSFRSPLPMISDADSPIVLESVEGALLHDPAAATAIFEDGVNLGLVLGEGYQGRPEVQEQIYALYCAYMRYRHAASTEQQTSFPHCSVFKKLPGTMHKFVQILETEAAPSKFPNEKSCLHSG